MNRFILTVPLVAGLVACVPQERDGPPAPIITVGQPAPKPIPARPGPATPSPRKERVEVYPYRPPASAPDASAHRGAPPAAKAPKLDPTPGSERAVSAPATSTPKEGMTPTRPVLAPAPGVVASVPSSSLPVPNLLPAAGTLIKQAEQQRRTKNYVSAVATLERALGIQPQEPYIWNRLARVRMEQGLYSQAGNLASRSNVLAGSQQVALKQDNWTIIAAARQATGDMAGAAKAQRNARGG